MAVSQTSERSIQPPPLPADLQERIDAARKSVPGDHQRSFDGACELLFALDGVSRIRGWSQVSKRYYEAEQAYATAKKAFADAQAAALLDPEKARSWPSGVGVYQLAVDDAYYTWRALKAQEFEEAMATLESLGVIVAPPANSPSPPANPV
jgi:hypothetical protein